MENQNKRPEDMPRQAKAQQPKLKEEKPGDALPPQQPLTDEEAAPKTTPRWRKIVKKVLLWLGVVLALVLSRFFGPTGIWCAWPVGWCTAAVLSIGFYRTGAWKNDPVPETEAA